MKREILETKMHEFVEYFHVYDHAKAMDMFAEDAVAHHFTGEKWVGREAIREATRGYFAKEFGEVFFDVGRVDVDEGRNILWSQWVMKLTKDGFTASIPGVDTFEFGEDLLIIRNSVFVKSTKPLTVTTSLVQ